MSKVRIVHNRLLRGWFIVRGPHQSPIGGRFDSKADAVAWLNRGHNARNEIEAAIHRSMRFNAVVWAQNNRGE
jgi:hypothetical protein